MPIEEALQRVSGYPCSFDGGYRSFEITRLQEEYVIDLFEVHWRKDGAPIRLNDAPPVSGATLHDAFIALAQFLDTRPDLMDLSLLQGDADAHSAQG